MGKKWGVPWVEKGLNREEVKGGKSKKMQGGKLLQLKRAMT